VENSRIVRVEWARLEGQRPRLAGCNARLGSHGKVVRPSVARITAEDGASGFGFARLTREQAMAVLGTRLEDAFLPTRGVAEALLPGAGDAWLSLEYPLWDLMARRAGVPVYALAAEVAGREAPKPPFGVPCYDTSLYLDDLHLTSTEEAAALIAAEAHEGYLRGHRAFKVKVGRGARHMPLEEGTRRDIAVVRAVRAAVGPNCPLMVDANNGYNLNLTKRVLAETADCRLYWMEEPFHEDSVLYRDLREWLDKEGLSVLIADGEGQASPSLLDWARERLVDVVQYDVHNPGFTRLLHIGQQLDTWGVRTAPHHYGGFLGNFVSGHLASAVRGFAFVEWDEATVLGVDASRYRVREGRVTLPNVPGFGVEYDEELFARAVADGGFSVAL
jgi:L-alanine-DL-glutamate epimerase-like enolase superfamily enzyme